MRRDFLWYLFLAAVFIMTFSMPLPVEAFGISPSKFVYDNVVPGSFTEVQVTFTRADASTDQTVQIHVEGTIKELLEFPNDQLVPFPKGMQQLTYHFVIHPPSNASGTYLGTFAGLVSSSSHLDTKKNKNNLSITVGAQSDFMVNIGYAAIENPDVIPDSLHIDTIIEQSTPLQITLEVENKGRSTLRPVHVHLIINKKGERESSSSEWLTQKKIKLIPAHVTATLVVTSKRKFSPGLYYVSAEVYDRKNKLIYRNSTSLVSVVPSIKVVQEQNNLKTMERFKEAFQQAAPYIQLIPSIVH